ncbi:MAG: alpha amylase N-terminal ig-like domain-containing protein [Lachnospiraceae bacterium]|nr:alpha amylase N-terminal ig-like domain-containing protein [Lachnospiraceae bacterium]
MIYSGISHYADQRDCFFLENGKLRIRISAARGDMNAIYLHTRDKYIDPAIADTRACCRMKKIASDFGHDYFSADIDIPQAGQYQKNPDMLCLRYFFEMVDEAGARIWYGDSRFFSGEPGDVEAMFDCPLISRRELTFRVPDWARNAVVYQIFPTRFATTEDVPDELWYKTPIAFNDDLHGNLKGITEHIPYLKELGVDVIYMTPIFRSNSSHKYDTIDYYAVDPSLGDEKDLHTLVNTAHRNGMRVMLDGVFNHTSPDFFAFRDIEENGTDSEYYDWYYLDSSDVVRGDRTHKPSYQSFAYVGFMPKLNLSNPDAAQYVIDVACHYIKDFGIDGWRLDVGDEIGHDFWKKFRRAVKSANPDALLVGEVWHFSPDFLQGDEWDSVMNYAFYKNIGEMICSGDIGPSEFLSQQSFLEGQYHSAVLPVLWNLIDSHDTSRFLWRAGGDKRKLALAAAFQMLLPGTPFIYYGDEIAMTGGDDPDNRRGMLWDEKKQDMDMYHWYQRLTYFRHTIRAITDGDYDRIDCDDERGLLEYHLSSGEILIFHTKDGDVSAREYRDYKELLQDKIFDGTISGYGCVLLRR